jgi:flagellar hook-length control protein FliK
MPTVGRGFAAYKLRQASFWTAQEAPFTRFYFLRWLLHGCITRMAMILPFTTSLPPESPYAALETLPRQETKTEESDTRDTIRDRKELDGSPDDDDFATMMGLLLAGSQARAATLESEKPQESATAVDGAATLVAAESVASSTEHDSSGGTEHLTQTIAQEASLNSTEENAQALASEEAAARLMKQTQLVAAGQTAMTNSTATVTTSESTQANSPLRAIEELAKPVTRSKAHETSSILAEGEGSQSTASIALQKTSELQPTERQNAVAAEPFEPAVAADNFPAETTFASVSEQLQSPAIESGLLVQDRLREAKSVRNEPSSSGSSVKSVSAASDTVSTQAVASSSLPATESGSVLLPPAGTVAGAFTAEPALSVFSTTSTNAPADTALKIERAMKSAEISVETVTADSIQDSLTQFWNDHSAGGNSHERSSSNSAESELTAIGGTQTNSDAARTAAAGATGATTAISPSEFTSTTTNEVRQPLSSQVSQAVLEHFENQSAQKSDALTVRLDPPELGEMVIEISRANDGLAVRVTAREPVTMDMLLARGREIEVQLRGGKMDLSSLEFLSPGMSGGGSSQDPSSRDTSAFTEGSANSSRRTGRTGSSASAPSTPAPPRVTNSPMSFRA